MAPLAAGEGHPQATPTSLSRVLEPLPTLWVSLPAGVGCQQGSLSPHGGAEPLLRGGEGSFSLFTLSFSKPRLGLSLSSRTGELESAPNYVAPEP